MLENYEVRYSKIKNVYIQIKEGKVIIKAPKRISKLELNKIVKEKESWIKKTLEKEKNREEKENLYTQEEFLQIVEKNFTELIYETKLAPNKIRIKNIKYAWGSCTSNKNITINAKLIKYSEEVIKYVILHELCHLKYMNHSKYFWELLKKYLPNYKEVKKQLKK